MFLKNTKAFIYSVRDASVADVNAAFEVLRDSEPLFGSAGAIVPLGLNYKFLLFEMPHTFAGSETWLKEISWNDHINNEFNPLFDVLQGVSADEISDELVKRGAGFDNMKLIREIIHKSTIGHLFKNGMIWNGTQKAAFNAYWAKLLHYTDLGNIGVALNLLSADKSVIDGGGTISITDPYSIVHDCSMLTSSMLQRAIDLCVDYKKRYPDGTV